MSDQVTTILVDELKLLRKVCQTSSDLILGKNLKGFAEANGGQAQLEQEHADAVHALESYHS